MADERRNPDAMSYEECRAECETLQREVGDDSTVHHSWDGNVHYWRGRLGSVRQDYDRVSDRTRGTIAALRARVADLERERDAPRGRIVTRLHEVADVIAGYTGSDPAAKEVAVYAAMRIRSAADEFLPDGALPPDAAKKVTCRQCVHQSEGVCREVGEWLSDPDAPFSRGACPNFTDRYPVEKDDTHER